MMDDRVRIDVFARVADPHFRVGFDEVNGRLEVVLGLLPVVNRPAGNLLTLCFTEPQKVVALGRELVRQGEFFEACRDDEAKATRRLREELTREGAAAPDDGRC